jgi:hypothetical protein
MEGLRNSIYNNWIKDIQEKGYLDYLVSTECRADNAYNGSPSTAQIVEIESNTVTSGNTNVSRDWDWYLGQVANANQIICNIDAIRDASGSTLTDSEYKQWKSEALTWRAFNLARLAQIWGGAPMTLTVPPAINAANVEQVYDLYFPKMSDAATVYGQAIQDLEYAAENLDVNTAGSADLSINGAAKKVTVNSSNSAKTLVSGDAKSLVVTGKGTIDASGLKVNEAKLNTNGATVKVSASKEIELDLGKGSEVEYDGDPTVKIVKIQSSSVTRK